MLVNIYHDSKAEHRKLMLAGVVFLTVMALLVALSIAIYNKAFTRSVTVTLQADRAGQQLPRLGDVRVNGVLVGYIKDVGSNGKQAVITLALQPEQAQRIPKNVGASIVPTTLFGQKYVQLELPSHGAAAESLRSGDVIPASRVKTTVELQQILAQLYPLLRSVKPQDLNDTLYAMAHALQGRGQKLGQSVTELNSYLKAMNPSLPQVRKDMVALARAADAYNVAAPDLVRVLRNATQTARTVKQKEQDFQRTLVSMTALSRSTRSLLADNEQALIDQGRYGRPLLALLDTYSPEFPCLLQGIARQRENTRNVFSNNLIHQTLELGAPQRKAYTAKDKPVFGEVGRGPWCLGLPDNYKVPAGFLPLRDGTDYDEPGGGLK